MASAANAIQGTLVEKLIKKHASLFLQDIKLQVHWAQGEILIRDLKTKPDLFVQIESFLAERDIDVWWGDGMSTLFPHGVELASCHVKEARVVLPTPNPFNGELWKIAVDGAEIEIKTLTLERRQELLNSAKARANEQAGVWRNRTPPASPAEAESPATPRDEAEDTNEADEGGMLERLQKRIDRYFKEHLSINFTNSHVIMRPGEDFETPEVFWDCRVGRFQLDLGVSEMELSGKLATCMDAAPRRSPLLPPPGVKYCKEELMGLNFSEVHVDVRAGEPSESVAILDFPKTAFNLHLNKRQWPEWDRTRSSGRNSIHAALPDAFSVLVHWDERGLRGGLLRRLHEIFDAVAVATPNFADWLTVPPDNGWDRHGHLVRPRELSPEALADEYCRLLARRDRETGEHGPANGAGWSWPWECFSCATEHDNDEESEEVLESFEEDKTSEWIAYWRENYRSRLTREGSASSSDRSGTSASTSGSSGASTSQQSSSKSSSVGKSLCQAPLPADCPSLNASQVDHWVVTPFHRFEVSCDFGGSFDVVVTQGPRREEALKLDFPPGMAVTMVRDSPAEWEISASMRGMFITSRGLRWLSLPVLDVTLGWGRRELLPEHLLQNVPEEVPSVCSIKSMRIRSGMKVQLKPCVVSALMPLLPGVMGIPLWPEMRNFFGEWGYMPRPMAYVVESMLIDGMSVLVSDEAKVDTESNARLSIALGPIAISTGKSPIYVDNDWAPWWNLNVTVLDGFIGAALGDVHRSVVQFASVGLALRRSRGAVVSGALAAEATPGDFPHGKPAEGTNAVQCTLHHIKVTVAARTLLCCVALGKAFWGACKDTGAVGPLLASASKTGKAFLRNAAPDFPTLPSWVWPWDISVKCADGNPIVLVVRSGVSSWIQAKVAFDLALAVGHLQKGSGKGSQATLTLEPASLLVQALDSGSVNASHVWEPLLEQWPFEVGISFWLNPSPGVSVSVGSKQEKPLTLNVSSAIVRAARELTISWAPVVTALISDKDHVELSKTSVLNLSGRLIAAQVKTLGMTVTDLIVKAQAVFRGRQARRKVKAAALAEGGAYAARMSTGGLAFTRSGSLPSIRVRHSRGQSQDADTERSSTLMKNMLYLQSSVWTQLSLGENQRLQLVGLSEAAMEGDLADSTKSWAAAGASLGAQTPTPKAPKKSKNGGFFGLGGCLGAKGEESKPEPAEASVGGQRPVATADSLPSRRLINVSAYGDAFSVPSAQGTWAAFLCQVITPLPNQSLLLLHSTVKIFNYTTLSLELGFFKAKRDKAYVDQDLVTACTCSAALLGDAQPIDPCPYGLPAAEPDKAWATEDQAWLLPSGCLISVPPRLRDDRGKVQLGLRASGGDGGKLMPFGRVFTVSSLQDHQVEFYTLPSGEVVQIVAIVTEFQESGVVARTHRTVSCWSVCVLPCLSVASACPLPVEVEVCAAALKMPLTLQPGSTASLYNSEASEGSVSLRVRFPGFTDWSGSIHDVGAKKSRKWSRSTKSGPQDETVVLPAAGRCAATEVVIRRGEVNVLASPIWLRDWSSLDLRCTDAKGLEFPRAGAFTLPDTSRHDNYVTLDAERAPYPAPAAEGGWKKAHAVPGENGSAKPAMQMVPVTGQGQASITLEGPKQWTAGVCRSFPLAVASEALEPVFGVKHTPPGHLLTLMPGLMFLCDAPAHIRQVCGEQTSDSVAIRPNTPTPVWLWFADKERKIQIQLAGASGGPASTGWSMPVACNHGSVGVHSLAIPEDGAGEGAAAVVTLDISEESSFAFSVRVLARQPRVRLRNSSRQVEVAAMETDAASSRRTSGSRAMSKRGSRGSAGSDTTTPRELPENAFRATFNKQVDVGWFNPTAKDADPDGMLHLQWTVSGLRQKVCGPLDLSWQDQGIFALLHPTPSAPQSSGVTTVCIDQTGSEILVNICDLQGVFDGPHARFVKGICTACGAKLSKPPVLLAMMANLGGSMSSSLSASGTIADTLICENCGAELRLPKQGAGGVASEELAHHIRRSTRLPPWIPPALALLSVKVDIKLPTVAVSVISKEEAQEVLFVRVDDIEVSVGAPSGMAHICSTELGVGSVRVDSQLPDLQARLMQTPAILASVQMNDSVEDRAVSLHVANELLWSSVGPLVFDLTQLDVRLDRRWEVVLDVAVINSLVQFGLECTDALDLPRTLGALKHGDRDELEPSAVLARLKELGRGPPDFVHKTTKVATKLDGSSIGDVEAKLWVSLNLSKMLFVPFAVGQLMKVLTLSSAVELKGAPVHMDGIELEKPGRFSLMELAQTLMWAYAPQIAAIAGSVLGSSNIGMLISAPARGGAWCAKKVLGAMAPTANSKGPTTASSGIVARSSAVHVKTNHTGPSTAAGSVRGEPEFAGASRLREPRVLFAPGARVVPYDEGVAKLCNSLSQREVCALLDAVSIKGPVQRVLAIGHDALILVEATQRSSVTRWPWSKVKGMNITSSGQLELEERGGKKICWPASETQAEFQFCKMVSRLAKDVDAS